MRMLDGMGTLETGKITDFKTASTGSSIGSGLRNFQFLWGLSTGVFAFNSSQQIKLKRIGLEKAVCVFRSKIVA